MFVSEKILGLLVAMSMLLPGCTFQSNTSSPKEIKRALLQTEVITSAGYLFPGDEIPAGPIYYRTPSSRGERHFRRLTEKLAVPLLAIQRNLRPSRLELLPTQRAIDHRKVGRLDIDLADEGTAIAQIDKKGRLILDLRVMHAVWIASVLEMPASWLGELLTFDGEFFDDDFFGDEGRRAEDEEIVVPASGEGIPREAIERAIGRAQAIRNSRAPSLVRDIFAEDPVIFDFYEQAVVVGRWETAFVGTLRFVLAHEMAHVALGHHEWLEGLAAEVEAGETTEEHFCHQRHMAEVEADFYAVILLRELNANVIERHKAVGGLSDLFGGFGLRAHAGFYSFLESAYQYAGFDDFLASGTCASHPPTELRIFAADILFQAFASGDPAALLSATVERFDQVLGEGWMEEEQQQQQGQGR